MQDEITQVSKKMKPSFDIFTALFYNNIEECAFMIRTKQVDFAQVEVDSKLTPVLYAFKKGNLELFKMLIDGDPENKGGWLNAMIDGKHILISILQSKKNLLSYSDTIYTLIDAKTDINYGDGESNPLYYAISNKFSRVAEYMLNAGAKIDNESRYSPLFAAINSGLYNIADRLIDMKCDVNFRSIRGGNLITTCCENVNLLMLKKLLDMKVSPNIHSLDGMTPIMKCLKIRSTVSNEAAKILLDYGADPNTPLDQMSPIMYACTNSDVEMVKLLIDKNADVNHIVNINNPANFTSVLYCSMKSTECLKLVLNAKCEVNEVYKNIRHPITFCLEKNKLDTLKLMLEAKVDPNLHKVYVNHPLDNFITAPIIFKSDSIDVLKLLIEHKADPNSFSDNNMSLLYSLTSKICDDKKYADMVIYLLENTDADPDFKTISGKCIMNHIITDNFTLEQKSKIIKRCKPNMAYDTDKRSILMNVVGYKKINEARLLLEAKENVNYHNGDGNTSLNIACDMRSNENMIGLLIEFKADPNIISTFENDNKLSPLMRLLRRDYDWDIIEEIIKVGANLNHIDSNGCTALIKMTDIKMIKKFLKYKPNVHIGSILCDKNIRTDKDKFKLLANTDRLFLDKIDISDLLKNNITPFNPFFNAIEPYIDVNSVDLICYLFIIYNAYKHISGVSTNIYETINIYKKHNWIRGKLILYAHHRDPSSPFHFSRMPMDILKIIFSFDSMFDDYRNLMKKVVDYKNLNFKNKLIVDWKQNIRKITDTVIDGIVDYGKGFSKEDKDRVITEVAKKVEEVIDHDNEDDKENDDDDDESEHSHSHSETESIWN